MSFKTAIFETAPPPLTPIATLVVWTTCAAVGLGGLALGYPSPRESSPEVPPTVAQLVQVEVPKAPPLPAPPEPMPPSAAFVPQEALPAAPSAVAAPAAPAITPVSAPSAAVAFAVPVEGLTRIVEVGQAAHGAPLQGFGGTGRGEGVGAPAVSPPAVPAVIPPTAGPPPVVHLTFGQGEGRQPPPAYPREAALARQEGTVTLRFSVDETGRVEKVDVAAAAPWPLLNQAAARAVRETWRFSPGPRRMFEVPIQFTLSK